MEASLGSWLRSEGVTEETMKVLTEEEVISMDILCALKEEHFSLLLPKLKVGQHALLLKLHRHSSTDLEVSCI